MRNKESIKDKISNNLLFVKAWLRTKVFRINNRGNQEPDLINMKNYFFDNFTFLDNKKWRNGQPWGLFHPDSPYQHYDPNSVLVDNKLSLFQQYSPQTLTTLDSDNTYDIPHSVGLISSLDSFGYGYYRFECKLPKGVGLWPAVWLSCVDSWPPEIDILEAYSDSNSDYKNNLQSNFHYDFDKNKKAAGARNHPVFSHDEIMTLGCWWTRNFIKIYYNGYLVRQITNESILKFFRDKKMIIILNNAIRPEFKDSKELLSQKSEFQVFSVNYWK